MHLFFVKLHAAMQHRRCTHRLSSELRQLTEILHEPLQCYRWSAHTKAQGPKEFCRGMTRSPDPEFCQVSHLATYFAYQLDINQGDGSFQDTIHELGTGKRGELQLQSCCFSLKCCR